MAAEAESAIARMLALEFRRRLLEEYVPRIRKCTTLLTEEQAWQRPSPYNNSVANLLLHLNGNVRQWILCGLGAEEDIRDRDSEFDAARERTSDSVPVLMDRLEETVRRAVDLVGGMPLADWMEERTFQGRYRETGVAAVVHVIEHFSGHAGQIYAYTKQKAETDLRFYDL